MKGGRRGVEREEEEEEEGGIRDILSRTVKGAVPV